MHFIKKSVRGLALFFFVILIFNLALVASLVSTFNSPKKIEKSLSDSGVYTTFVSSALQEVQKSSQQSKSSETGDIPINNPAIIAAANTAFTPQLLQSTTESVLNGTYDWLSGKVATPNFTVNLVAAKQTFAQAVGEAAKKQLASLPVCTPAQATKQGSDINAFSATCRPANLNLTAEQKKITKQLATSKDFLGTPKLTAQNMPKNDQGKTVFDQLAQAPKVYKWVNASPWLLALLALIAGVISFFLFDSRRKGFKTLAIILTVIGVLLLLISLGTAQAFHHLNEPTGKLGEAVKGSFQQTIIKALDSISASIEQVIMWFGLGYTIVGAGTLTALHFIKPKSDKDAPKTDEKEPTPPIDDSPKNEPKPTKKPEPKAAANLTHN